jgi:hypothetical protein
MKKISLALAVLMLASSLPLRAQVVAGSRAATVAEPVKEATCPCDQSNFKPLTDKARAVAEYWDARRRYKSASTVAGAVALFAIIARDGNAMNEAQNTLSAASTELHTARDKAVALDGIKVTDGDDKTVELKLQKGVDYTLTP